eukprot:scaffold4.g4732.t1
MRESRRLLRVPQDTTLSFAFTDATLKDLKGGKDIVIGAEQKLGDGVKGAVAYNVGQKNGEASLTVDRKVGGNDLSLKAIYHQKGDVFILEESWKFDKNNKLSGTYNFQTEAATFTYTHIQGPWTAEGKYDFARDAPTLTVKRKQGKATLSAAYGLKDQAAALTTTMKQLITQRDITIPEGVSVEVKARKVRVKGPRGVLARDFKHMNVDLYLVEEEGVKKMRVDRHFGRRKQLASIRTVCSHVLNMITGVTKGFEYKMRLVYAHFPININIEGAGTKIEIRNFLGEKIVRVVDMLPGVKVERSAAVKDELVLTGNDVELTSRSAALIHQKCLVKHKARAAWGFTRWLHDIRKFLDGIYVSERGTIVKEE